MTIGAPCGLLSLRKLKESYGLTLFRELDNSGLGSFFAPVTLHLRKYKSKAYLPGHILFWFKLVSTVSLLMMTMLQRFTLR